MSSLRNILQRCARKASIVGGTPLQIQCTFNPVYSAYPTSISRQAYSSDANETPKNANDPVQKLTFGQTDSMKFRPNATKGQTVTKNKNLNLRNHYVYVCGLSKKTTPESLRKFYSQFGEIAYCDIIFESEPRQGKNTQVGCIGFTSKVAINFCIVPKCIDGQKRISHDGSHAGRKHRLKVLGLSSKTTIESLKEFYSRFGSLSDCWINQGTTDISQVGNVVFEKLNDLHHALDAQPHVIDGSEVLLKYETHDLDLWIGNIPEGVTEEALREFYSKYGQLRQCQLLKEGTGIPYAFVSYSARDEVNHAMDDLPHIIGGKPLKVNFLREAGILSLFDGSLPENVTEETLREVFSKYGKPVYWEMRNDGRFNQARPYGIVVYGSEEELNRAMDDRPHIIDGKPLHIRSIGKGQRKVLLFVESLPENVTEETLRKEFSKYGKLVFWELRNDGCFNQSGPYGIVSYPTNKETLKALNSGPHTIEGAVVDVRKAEGWDCFERMEFHRIPHLRGEHLCPVFLFVGSLPENVTDETLREEFSKYGKLVLWEVRNDKRLKQSGPYGIVAYATKQELNRAMDDRPHIIDGKPLHIRSIGKGQRKVLLFVESLPENVTEETLRKEFSKYGKLVFWELRNDGCFNQSGPYGIVSYPTNKETLKALNSGPHTIEGAVVDVRKAEGWDCFERMEFHRIPHLRGEHLCPVFLFVGSLPENVTDETLREEFSKYGKLVLWEVRNDKRLKQSGPYGIVAYATKQEALKALNSGSHTIEGAVVDVRKPTEVLKAMLEEIKY